MADENIIVKGNGAIFLGGPALVFIILNLWRISNKFMIF